MDIDPKQEVAAAIGWDRADGKEWPHALAHIRKLEQDSATLARLAAAARAWDEASDELPMAEQGRIRGEFDDALASASEQG